MATPESEVNAYLDAANAALDNSNFSVARLKIAQAGISLSKLPEEEEHPGIGEVKHRLVKDIRDITSLIDQVEADINNNTSIILSRGFGC